MKKPKQKCCNHPNVKNEGRTIIGSIINWEYHCFSCNKTWTEFEKKN